MTTALSAPLFGRMAIIGPGLIGSSLGLVCQRHALAQRRIGCARTADTRAQALEVGAVDEIYEDAAQAVEGADLVVLATPVGTFKSIAQQIAPALEPGCIVTDVGSVKKAVLETVSPHLPDHVHFVPSHPIAGTELSGPTAGFADLFKGRWCVLTPAPNTQTAAIDKITALWEGAGMSVEIMDADHHDSALAITSHLPHLIAFTIVGTATDLEQDLKKEVMKFAAGGFRDFTRIAASDPVMWRDIFLNNRSATLEILGRFTEDLAVLQKAIRRGDGEILLEKFTKTHDMRRGVIEADQA